MPPWEKYKAAAPEASGPWAKYSAPVQTQEKTLLQAAFPSGSNQYDAQQIDFPMSYGALPQDVKMTVTPGQQRGVGAIGDALSLASRAAGATAGSLGMESATGGRKPFREALADPETGLMRSARQGSEGLMRESMAGLKNKDRHWSQKIGDASGLVLGGAGYGVSSAIEDLSNLIPGVGAVKGTVKAGKAIGKQAEKAAGRSIVSKYNATYLKDLAPSVSDAKTIDNAPDIIADKLRKNNLLYSPGEARFNLDKGLRDFGQQIDQTIKEATERDVVVNVRGVLDRFKATRASIMEETGKGSSSYGDLMDKAMPKIESMVERLKPNELGNVSQQKAVNFRRDLQDMVKNWGEGENKQLIQQVAKELQSSMNKDIAASHKVYGPKLAALNERFSELKEFEPLIEDAYTRGFGRSAANKNAVPISLDRHNLISKAMQKLSSPIQTLMDVRPEMATRLANKSRVDRPVEFTPGPSSLADGEVDALKAPFIQDAPAGELSPRKPTGRPALDKQPEYLPAAPKEGLQPRQVGNASPGRRPILPFTHDPSLDVSELGKVMDAAAAKDVAKYQYRSERLAKLWEKVKASKTQKEKTALMNLIRATHGAK